MQTKILTYLMMSIIFVMFNACGANTTSTSYESSPISSDYSLESNEIPTVSTVTSFAEDLKFYDIANLDESASLAMRKAESEDWADDSSDDSSENDSSDDSSEDDSSDDSSDDDSSDDSSDDDSNDDSSENDSSDDSSDDDSNDDSSENDSNDDSSEDDSSDDSSEDDSSDDSSDDDSSDDSSENDSSDDSSEDDSSDDSSEDDSNDDSLKQVDEENNILHNDFLIYEKYTGYEIVEYESFGTIDVSLNNKNYKFQIVKDNTQEREEVASFTLVDDESYRISITSYIIKDNILKKEDGIFTFVITVPSLNTSGMYKVESNVLTNSAEDDVYAMVSMYKDETETTFNAIVAKFPVFNRDKTKVYNANFTISYKSQ